MADVGVIDRGVRKHRKGTVIRRSGNKTVVVLIESRGRHPVYGKVVSSAKKFHVHDEDNSVNVGDYVKIVETRPLSKLKRWRIMEVVSKAKVSGATTVQVQE